MFQLKNKKKYLEVSSTPHLIWNFVTLLSDICILFQRVHLDIQVGEHAVDYQQIQAKDKLTELQLRIRQLLDQVEQVTKEQNYQRVSMIYNVVSLNLLHSDWPKLYGVLAVHSN